MEWVYGFALGWALGNEDLQGTRMHLMQRVHPFREDQSSFNLNTSPTLPICTYFLPRATGVWVGLTGEAKQSCP